MPLFARLFPLPKEKLAILLADVFKAHLKELADLLRFFGYLDGEPLKPSSETST
jgi:hypothetical protein